MHIPNCVTPPATAAGTDAPDTSSPSHEPARLDEVRRFAVAMSSRLQESLAAGAQAFARRAGCPEGCIRLDGLGTLVWRVSGPCVETGWRPVGAPSRLVSERRSVPRESQADAWTSLAIAYASCRIGELRLRTVDDQVLESARVFARRCSHAVQRHQLLQWSRERLGEPMVMTGASRPMQRLEAFIEMGAGSDLPVLIRGETGTEKALVAAAIHVGGTRPGSPFVEVVCAHPLGTPEDWFRDASGGTLFFSGIDELPSELQAELCRFVSARPGQRPGAPTGEAVRLIASMTTDQAAPPAGGRMSRALLAELDVLSTTVPPLRERLDDLEALVATALLRVRRTASEACVRELAKRCRRHTWPENLAELERVIARLPPLDDVPAMLAGDVASPTPWHGEHAFVFLEPDAGGGAAPSTGPAPRPQVARLQRWVDDALAFEPERLQRLHPALRKALAYLGHHFAEPMSLGELAASAHVSPSHLAFLFRSVVGHPFKHVLQAIRIERAKGLLRDDPHQRVTDVALNVGFRDLSHFEKCFRRTVGKTPREFRARNSSSLA